MELSLVRLPLGKETRLPLVMCPWCRRARVIELRAMTYSNSVFSSNAPAIHNWQAELLVVLIKGLEQVFFYIRAFAFGLFVL